MLRRFLKNIIRPALAVGVLAIGAGTYAPPMHAHASGCSTLTVWGDGTDSQGNWYFTASYPYQAGVTYNSFFQNQTNQLVYSGNPASWVSDNSGYTHNYQKYFATRGVPWVTYFTDQYANGCSSNAHPFTT